MLLKFFSLTFLLSWISFAAVAWILHSAGNSPSGIGPVAALLFIPGVIMPALVAVALTAWREGRTGVSLLLKGITEWRRDVKWYAFAIGFMAAIKLVAAALYRLTTGTWPMFSQTPWLFMAIAIVFSTPVQAGEEIGWRAFALPRMTQFFGLPLASIILGVIWASWHLPFFFIPGSDNFGQSFWMYLMAVTAISVAMAWLYWRTKESLLLVMIMHASIDNTAGIVTSPASAMVRNPFALSTSPLAWFTVAILWICAGYLIFRMRTGSITSMSKRTLAHS